MAKAKPIKQLPINERYTRESLLAGLEAIGNMSSNQLPFIDIVLAIQETFWALDKLVKEDYLKNDRLIPKQNGSVTQLIAALKAMGLENSQVKLSVQVESFDGPEKFKTGI